MQSACFSLIFYTAVNHVLQDASEKTSTIFITPSTSVLLKTYRWFTYVPLLINLLGAVT